MKFIHRISKGSRFNQIYVPKEMESIFDVGDLVEVRLLKKNVQLHYSKNLLKLSEFKEKLIKEIFLVLSQFGKIKQSFIVGSFLTQKIDYNDIDIVIIINKEDKNVDEIIYNKLVDKFNLRFHVISIPKDRFDILEQVCPLTRNMFYYSVSDKKIDLSLDKKIDKNHIEFLLMMPEDLLEIKLNSRVFFDNIRRLITIERFLEDKTEDPNWVNKELIGLIGDFLFNETKNNEVVNEKDVEKLREIIKIKLNKIRKWVKQA